jgi:hypothetical protein
MRFVFDSVVLVVALILTALKVDKTIGSNSELNINDVNKFNKNKLLAQKGDPVAQNLLGWMYDQGIGVKEDPIKAVKWYLKSANQGLPKAQVNVGVMNELGRGTPQNFQEANKWYLKAETIS